MTITDWSDSPAGVVEPNRPPAGVFVVVLPPPNSDVPPPVVLPNKPPVCPVDAFPKPAVDNTDCLLGPIIIKLFDRVATHTRYQNP